MIRLSKSLTRSSVMPERRVMLGRRSMLLGCGVAGLLGAAGYSSVLYASDQTDFLKVSSILTGKDDLDPTLAARYEASLTRHQADFPKRLNILGHIIAQGSYKDVESLFASSLMLSDRETAMSIISAWYLGVVGEADQAELIAFSDALMYQPCTDVLVVPSYGAGPLAWGEKPPV